MNKKIAKLILVFLLLIPFRLPVGVVFINLITWMATMAGDLSDEILAANVVVTKVIYDITLAVLAVYNVEMLSRKIKGRKPQEIGYNHPSDAFIYWWVIPVIMFLFAYTIFDGINTYDLFYILR